MKLKSLVLSAVFLSICGQVYSQQELTTQRVAPHPPMGWNSYDAYDWRINEKEFKANVDFMAEKLRQYGWQYAVVDFLWYELDPQGNLDYKARKRINREIRYGQDGYPLDSMAMDQYGRLLPDPLRFPSSVGGKGFKPLADYVHGRGLKFGIHIMRGIPRAAVYFNTQVMGTRYTARDIADMSDTCDWANNMYGVNPSKPGAQAYYDSIFRLYASWGVDFIKADDILSPVYHKREIEMIHVAIAHSGRPMVLSLSPGEAPFSEASHLMKNANMWRISNDFWDNWSALSHAFVLLDGWSNYSGPGHWPDADMLPIGHISLNDNPVGKERISNFNMPELFTLMTLWCIARSPLIIGSDLPTMPDSTLPFLTNREVIEVSQNSTNNRQIYRSWDNNVYWMADVPNSNYKYLAMFNLSDKNREVNFDFDWQHLHGKYEIRDLWNHRNLGVFERAFTETIPGHGAGLYRFAKSK
jgi:alpha-galactosidase